MSDMAEDRSKLEQTARNIVLRQLAAAPKTRQQLAEKLFEGDIPEDIVDEVLDRFEDLQLIDDAAYALMWVSSRHRSKGLARRALSRELQQRGIDDEDAEAALAQVTDADEWNMAHELVTKRLSRSSTAKPNADDRKQRDRVVRRLVGFLSRKGYAPGLAFSVVSDVMNADDLDYLDE